MSSETPSESQSLPSLVIVQTTTEENDGSSMVHYLLQTQTVSDTEAIQKILQEWAGELVNKSTPGSEATAGQTNIETNAPVNHYQEVEINMKLLQTVEDFGKILEMFDKESRKDIQSLDVAKLTNIRRHMLEITNLLFFLSDINLLTLRTREYEIGLRWSSYRTNTYTASYLQAWAGELVKNTKAKDLRKILEIFNKESSKDIKPLDVAKLMNIGSSEKAVNSLLYFLKKKNILTVKTGENNTDPRWSRHPTNTYTEYNLKEWAAELVNTSAPDSEAKCFCKLDLKCDNVDIHCIVDRRLERKYANLNSVYKHEPYEQWFCKLDLKCDNVDIHCIVDRRLERKYASLNSVYKHEPYERISTGPLSFVNLFDKKKMTIEHLIVDDQLTMTVNQLNQTTQSEFEQLYTIKSTVSDRSQLDLRRALVDASRQKFSILCRWLMANIHNRGVSNNEMEPALDIAFKNLDKDTAKAISWCITKTFYKTFQVNLSHCFDVYPGLRCQCLNKGKNTNTLCSNDKLIIITADTEVKGLPEEYKGFKIKIMDVHDKSTEKSEGETLSALLTKNYTDSYHIKVNISNTTAKKLFDSHSNLALICPGVHRSFSFARKHKVKNELCIQLYCKLKGILPLGEIHFPDSIHGIPTDVIDGEACFISKLRIGDKIGQLTSTGTLGGFVRYLGFECFLTCAHVMYDVQTLLGSSSNCAELREAKSYIHTPFSVIECGQVIWRAFDHDDRSKTSVDAALVLLQNNFTMDPNDYIQDNEVSYPFSKLGLSSPYLNMSLLDHEDFCVPKATATVVAKGAMTSLRDNVTFPKQSDVDIVFSNIGQAAGIANGNEFHPLWIYTPVHMQSTEGYLTDKRVFRMYNQIAIKNLGLQPGDSGTCIYIIEHPQNNGCIGMAIAFCGDLTIVTPLKDIIYRMSNMY